MSDRAQGRIVLVTGASSGLGRATAQSFAQHGFRVFGTSRRTLPVVGGGVEMLPLDVRSPQSVTGCVEELLRRAGRIDVLVNNAGVMHEGFAEETSMQEAEDVFAANFFGTARLTHAVLPHMRSRRGGRIINVGSLAAWVGEPGEGFYAASKAALARYTEALRHEVWHLGLAVSLVEPGAFRTGVLRTASATTTSIADYDGPRERPPHAARQHAPWRGPARGRPLIVRVAQDRAPQFRYGAGRDGRWLPRVKTLIPQSVFETLLRRSFGLPDQRGSPGTR